MWDSLIFFINTGNVHTPKFWEWQLFYCCSKYKANCTSIPYKSFLCSLFLIETLDPPYDSYASLNRSSISSLLYSFFWLYNHKHFKRPVIIYDQLKDHTVSLLHHTKASTKRETQNMRMDWQNGCHILLKQK